MPNIKKNTESNSWFDENDTWCNELDEKTIEIINSNLMTEEDSDNDNKDCEVSDEINSNYDNSVCICVDDILEKDPNLLSSNEVMQYECTIAYFVQVLTEESIDKLKSDSFDCGELSADKIKDIIGYYKWISISSDILSRRIKQEPIFNKFEERPTIIRSSYNFCTGYTQCKKFYSKHEKPKCKEHHFVHSLLKCDVDSVIAFLNYILENNIIMSISELNNLYLSIKTICFVTRHMAKEISYIDQITNNNSEFFHRNNPVEFKRGKRDRGISNHSNSVHSNSNNPETLRKSNSRYGRSNKFYKFKKSPESRSSHPGLHNRENKYGNRNKTSGAFINTSNKPMVITSNNIYSVLENK